MYNYRTTRVLLCFIQLLLSVCTTDCIIPTVDTTINSVSSQYCRFIGRYCTSVGKAPSQIPHQRPKHASESISNSTTDYNNSSTRTTTVCSSICVADFVQVVRDSKSDEGRVHISTWRYRWRFDLFGSSLYWVLEPVPAHYLCDGGRERLTIGLLYRYKIKGLIFLA